MLASCASCSGFLPPRATSCPNCGHAASPRLSRKGLGAGIVGGLLAVAVGGATSVTLMACSGAGPCEGGADAGCTGAGGGGAGGGSSSSSSSTTTSSGAPDAGSDGDAG